MAREAGLSVNHVAAPPKPYDQIAGYGDALERALNAAYIAGAAAEREAMSRIRAPKPRELPQVGTGALWSEQQFCFAKGYREGAAALRKAIRARGDK